MIRTTLGRCVALAAMSVVPAACAGAAGQDGIRSVFSDLTGEACRTRSASVEEAWAIRACPAPGGFELQVADADLRQSVTVVDLDGVDHPQDYWQVIANGFSALGQRAEWRVRGAGVDATPVALVVPVRIFEPEDGGGEREVIYVAVSKITPDAVCVTDRIDPGPQQHEQALSAADASADRPCLASLGGGTQPERPAVTGRRCYLLEEPTLTARTRLDIDDAGGLTGRLEATIHNEGLGYFTSYVQQLDGQVSARADAPGALAANVEVTSWIEFDVQRSTEAWTVSPEGVRTPNGTFTAVPCEDGSELPDGLEQLGIDDASLRTQTVQLPPQTPVTRSGAVIRGERDRYLSTIEAGRILELRIASLEDNAVFDVIDPSGLLLARESTEEEIVLPHVGEYQIIVGGTRGNASYDLVFTLR